jgi:hypothetical protein
MSQDNRLPILDDKEWYANSIEFIQQELQQVEDAAHNVVDKGSRLAHDLIEEVADIVETPIAKRIAKRRRRRCCKLHPMPEQLRPYGAVPGHNCGCCDSCSYI